MIVVVLAGYNNENCVYYNKMYNARAEEVALAIYEARLKGADFVLVRFVVKSTQGDYTARQ